MPTNAPGEYPDHAAEAASLDLIARFAVAQDEIASALDAYLANTLSEAVKTVLTKRLRLSDDERLAALLALAKTVGYPLHVDAYRATFRRTKAVRDRFAHGGRSLAAVNETTAEPGLYMLGATEGDNRYYRLSELRSTAQDAHWLSVVPWRLRALLTGDRTPLWVRQPSDLPRSAVADEPAPRAEWGPPPICPNDHADVYGVLTVYGDAWLCAHCANIRMRDESVLVGSRDVLHVD